ncbi:PilZ domain-containing protein [Pajaroellobacter abortibovis]|uniref:PilZ domain-containing protein n=1 Tax=Pajaroellobacter abortibovis TaxID=1882918 RepID=A0A1L6MUV6_9BACT|nr:PilZ domain-containing protein [Pajaroellobacter abortibovis]APR99293.1 hypothetical protein BCY86_00340 [Pajaroellobacter abortibovis]
MSDFLNVLRNARELVAGGLSALQSDPQLPRPLVELAASLGQAIYTLQQAEGIPDEKSTTPYITIALQYLQKVLASLKQQPSPPAVAATATGAITRAIAILEPLVGITPATPPVSKSSFPLPAPVTPSSPLSSIPPKPIANPQPTLSISGGPSPPVSSISTSASNQSSMNPIQTIEASLGTYSATNFYKGLVGNDIIDHGGLFVSTYLLPKIGSHVQLKVALPGGYEFEAKAIVRWRREASDAGQDAPPGFGAQLIDISPEAKQLVYRYVKNREPLFHDDT